MEHANTPIDVRILIHFIYLVRKANNILSYQSVFGHSVFIYLVRRANNILSYQSVFGH